MKSQALAPQMASAWTYPQSSPGLWFNTTDASQDGAVLVGGTFQFKKSANFGFYVLNQAGAVLQSDVWDNAHEGVFWVKLNAGGTIAAGGGWLTSTYTGQLRAISVSDGSVLLTQPTGSRVNQIAMSADGSKFAAAISGANGIYYFDRAAFIQTGDPQWQVVLPNISTSSCVGMSTDGTFLVGLSNSSAPLVGYAYRVNDGGTSGTLAWSTTVEYWPNPSNNILGGGDALVSFGTGEPNKDGTLTPGHYYVLDANNGRGLGIFDTSAMNWPFQLSGDGGFAIGGSDDGYLYGFSAQGNWRSAI